jgi:uncharacterized membrane protein YedE/YeeE
MAWTLAIAASSASIRCQDKRDRLFHLIIVLIAGILQMTADRSLVYIIFLAMDIAFFLLIMVARSRTAETHVVDFYRALTSKGD